MLGSMPRPVWPLLLTFAAVLAAEEPRFTPGDELILPADYGEWPLAGSSLGMSYADDPNAAARREFHHVYLDPAAWRAYRAEGRFPEGTVLVMEVWAAASRESINRSGDFSKTLLRVEAAVKDSARFPDAWAYFDFGGAAEGGPRREAAAFPADRCWSCHHEHAAEDNVFTQFYGPLRAGR